MFINKTTWTCRILINDINRNMFYDEATLWRNITIKSKSQIHNKQVYSMSCFIDRFPFIVTLGVTNALIIVN